MQVDADMDIVLDASVTVAWCFFDEATPKTVALLESLENAVAHVPEIWPLEIANILVMAERRGRIHYAKITEFLSLLTNLNIQIDNETASRSFREILALAHAEKLNTYDAAYLELAMRLGLPLATKDTQLIKVAKHLGVRVSRV